MGAKLLAEGFMPTAAATAVAARRVMVYDDAIADGDGCDFLADCRDLCHKLVS